jgi:hypothetical protein
MTRCFSPWPPRGGASSTPAIRRRPSAMPSSVHSICSCATGAADCARPEPAFRPAAHSPAADASHSPVVGLRST